MHKTMLAALIVATSALSVPALAQVNLGGAAQVGAGAHVGTAAPNAMHTVGQTTAQTEQTLHRTDSHVKHRTRRAVDKTRSTVNDNANTNANANANGTIGAGAGDTHANANVDAGAGLDTAATAGKAGDMGQGVGGDVRDAAHSAIQSTDRSAGSVGNAVQQTATGQSVGAGVKTDASAGAHGH